MRRSNRSIAVPGVRPLLALLAAGSVALAGCAGAATPSPAASAAASVAASVAASAAASAASSAPSASPSAACAIPPCDQPIVIGVSQALTGDKADPGTAIEQGYEVWAKEVNDAGGLLGRQVVIKSYDNQSLADTAVSQMERLATVDKVDLMFGPFSSVLTGPTSAVAAKYKYAYIEGAGGSPSVFSRNFTNIFFVQPATADHQAD
ncbi:MAG TPA: ABC transporter substrate-binding protein, partial [Candidatus Limnocylindrales bacterium]